MIRHPAVLTYLPSPKGFFSGTGVVGKLKVSGSLVLVDDAVVEAMRLIGVGCVVAVDIDLGIWEAS